MKQTIALIGPGRVGCAIAKRLYQAVWLLESADQASYPITAVVGRDQQKAVAACEFIGCSADCATTELDGLATAGIILLAVPDDKIASLAKKLQTLNSCSADTTFIHFSGLHPAEIMHQHNSAAQLLSLHPLLPFADAHSGFVNLDHCPCALEGDEAILALGEQLVRSIGGQSFMIKGEQKALYHTAASIASNFLVTLIAWAQDLLTHCKIDKPEALSLLMPLVQASVENIKTKGPEQALTGPIVRGDGETLRKHLEELEKTVPDQREAYLKLARMTLDLAEKSGRLDNSSASNLRTVLDSTECLQVEEN